MTSAIDVDMSSNLGGSSVIGGEVNQCHVVTWTLGSFDVGRSWKLVSPCLASSMSKFGKVTIDVSSRWPIHHHRHYYDSDFDTESSDCDSICSCDDSSNARKFEISCNVSVSLVMAIRDILVVVEVSGDQIDPSRSQGIEFRPNRERSKRISKFMTILPSNARGERVRLNEEPGKKLRLTCKIMSISGGSSLEDKVAELAARDGRLREFDDYEGLLQDELFADVTFSVKGQKLLGHKAVLAARCPALRAMFQQQMRESSTNVVVIEDVEYKAMRELLRFLYVGRVNGINEMGFDLLVAADKYGVESLRSLCEAAILRTLNNETAVEYLQLSDKCKVNELIKAKIIDYIVRSSEEIGKQPNFQSMVQCDSRLLSELVQAGYKHP